MRFTTREAARLAGVPTTTVYSMLRREAIAPPLKLGTGDYLWDQADVDRLRAALAAARRQQQEPAAAAV